MKQAFVGVDIGGTNIVIGVFNEDLHLLLKNVIPTLKPHFPNKTNHPASFFDALGEAIHTLVIEAGFEGNLACVGLGVPGKVDCRRGIALDASNLGWYDVPIAEEMQNRLGVPVWIDNDVRIYTLGEAMAGAGRGYRDIVCVTLGTGLAAGMIINGNMLRGSNWSAGEIGHDAVPGGNYLCNCGKMGCMETITSATGITRLAQEAILSGKETSLSQLQHKPSAFEVYQACTEGDPVALEIFQYVGTVLGNKLTTVLLILNSEIVIIGGGVSAAGEYLLEPVREAIYRQYKETKQPVITAGQLGDLAGLVGAVHYALALYKEN